MYFINKHGFIVSCLELIQSDVAKNVACYENEETLQIDYPNLTDSMVNEIPILHIETNEQGVFYRLNSPYINKEPVDIGFLETIEDWIEEQTDTFHVERDI